MSSESMILILALNISYKISSMCSWRVDVEAYTFSFADLLGFLYCKLLILHEHAFCM